MQSSNCRVPVELWNKEKLISEIKSYMYDSEEGWELLDKSCGELTDSEQEIKTFDIDKFTTGPLVSQSQITQVRNKLKEISESGNKLIDQDCLKLLLPDLTLMKFRDALKI